MGKLAGYYIVGGCSCLVISWLVILLLPFGWHQKMSPFIKWESGLVYIHMNGHKKLWGFFQQVTGCPADANGYQTLATFQQCWCGMEKLTALIPIMKRTDYCGELHQFLLASLFLFMSGLICCIFLIIACGCMLHYWMDSSRRKLRMFIRLSLIIGPTAVTVGMFAYSCFTWNSLTEIGSIMELVPWASATRQSIHFGYSYFFAVFLVILTWIPLLATEHFGKAGLFEELQEVIHAERKERMWEEINDIRDGVGALPQSQQQYGAMPQSQQYGATPQSQQYGAMPHYGGAVVYDTQGAGGSYAGGGVANSSQSQQPPSWGVGPPPGAFHG